MIVIIAFSKTYLDETTCIMLKFVKRLIGWIALFSLANYYF